MLKKLLATLGGVVVLLLVIPVLLSSKMHVIRSIEIQSPAATVHTYLANLNDYPKWNPFSENDPTATNQINGTGVGSFLAWKGNQTGEGKMTITQIQPNERIQLKLEFHTPMAGEALIEWTTEPVDANRTRMIWTMDQDLPYFQRYFGLFMNGMIGKTFDKGLNSLKKQLERF